jgi:transcriptional/translational regulatory protein YebC/TACO1
MTEPGAVLWMFERKGFIVIENLDIAEDDLFEVALDAGADDFKESDGAYEVYTTTDGLGDVTDELNKRGINPAVSEVGLIPKNLVSLEAPDAKKLLRLMEELEDHDDVQKVSANFDIPDEVMEELTAEG